MDIKVELPAPRLHPLVAPRASRKPKKLDDVLSLDPALTFAHAMPSDAPSRPEPTPPVRAVAPGDRLATTSKPATPEPRETLAERLATIAGWAMSPLFAFTSLLRRARTFHPDGDVFKAEVIPASRAHGAEAEVGKRLAGRAIVRLSSALVKGEPKYPDVLGCAIRFGEAGAVDRQDLLLATVRRPYFLFLSPFFTHVHDYLENDYFGVSPFDVDGLGMRYFRLRPIERTFPIDSSMSRSERISLDARDGQAAFCLGTSKSPWGPFSDVATVALAARADIPSSDLHFVPSRAGRGLRPRGVIHALRRGVYAASQWARDLTTRPTAQRATT